MSKETRSIAASERRFYSAPVLAKRAAEGAENTDMVIGGVSARMESRTLLYEWDEYKIYEEIAAGAFDDVLKAGATVERFEPDHLVSLADIAKRTGLSRSALTNYHKGDRGSDFPTPVARVTSDSPLWDWCEVATWLHGRDQIGREAVIQARIVREANLVIETHSLQPDHFVARMTERVLELEAA